MTRWIAAGGALMVSLDSMVNVAFPAMAAAFALRPEQIRWVIVAYVLSYAVLSFAGGALGDRVGHARVFAAGLGGCALGFLVSALAPSFGWLLAGRVVQGVASGLVYGTAPALSTLGVPEAGRTRALAFLNAAMGVGFSVGPLLAGWLVAHHGWAAVFGVRAPLALAVLGWALVSLDARAGVRAAPLVAVRDLARGPVLVASALAVLANGGIFAIWLLAPFLLIERRGLDATAGGLLFMLTPVGTALGAHLAGRVPPRAGRALVVGSLAVEAAGLAALGTTGAAAPLPLVAVALLAAGLGVGAFQVSNMAAIMAEFPPGQQGAAGGLAFLVRTLGIVAGVQAWARVFAWGREDGGFDAGFRAALLAAAACVALAAALGARPRPVR